MSKLSFLIILSFSLERLKSPRTSKLLNLYRYYTISKLLVNLSLFFAHGKNKRFFYIHFGEYIVLKNIYILLYIQSLPHSSKTEFFGLDFSSIVQAKGRQAG